MNLKHFANSFKKAVADHASPERKLEIYARGQKNNQKNSSAQILGPAFDYGAVPNTLQGSVVIES